MQLDAEEDGQPYHKAPIATPAPPTAEAGATSPEGETQAENAATVTLEQEA